MRRVRVQSIQLKLTPPATTHQTNAMLSVIPDSPRAQP